MRVVPVERFGSRYDLPLVLPGLTKLSKSGEVKERQWCRWQVGQVDLTMTPAYAMTLAVGWHVPNLNGPGSHFVTQMVPKVGLREVDGDYPLPHDWYPGLAVEHRKEGWQGTIESVDWSKTNGPIVVKTFDLKKTARGWRPEQLRLIGSVEESNVQAGMPTRQPAPTPETAAEEVAAGVQPARAADPEMTETVRAERRMGSTLHEPDPAPVQPEREQIHLIPLGQIGHFPGGNQRTTFDADKLDELAESIRSVGLLNPLVVNEVDGCYTLIAGERRLRAADIAGRTTVECRVLHLTHEQALEAMLVENLQREDLNSMDEARAYKRLLELPGASQVSVAKRVGKSQQHVNEYLQLLELSPEMQQEVATGVTSARLAVIFLRQTKDQTPEVQAQVAQTLTQERPSSRQAPELIRRAVEKITGKPAARKPAVQPEPEPASPPEEPTARAVPVDPQPPVPEKQTIMFVAIQTRSLDELSVQQSQGLGSWPERPTGYDTVFDIEMGLTIADVLASWEQRMAVVDGYLPRGFGTVEIHIPSQSVWIRGRETQAVKQASQYLPEELALVLPAGGGLIAQCAGGRVVDTYTGQPVYYRAALYSGPSSKLFRQQVVVNGSWRDIVITGSDTVPINQDQVQRLTDFLRRLGDKGDSNDG